MQFLLMICLMMACLPVDWPKPPAALGSRNAVLLLGTIVLVLLLAAAIISRLTCRAFRRPGAHHPVIAHYYGVARTWFFFANLAAFAASLFLLGWGWIAIRFATVEINGWPTLIPGGELLVLAPFFLVQFGSWALTYDAARIIHAELVVRDQPEPFWSRLGFVSALLRESLLVFLPLILLIAVQGTARVFPELFQKSFAPLLSAIGMIVLFVGFPLLLPTILPLSPLQPGPARDRLEACARRLRFRYGRFYVWKTRGALANALIAGVIPRFRYVILSDRLLKDLSDAEQQAVIGHEIGHAHHGHLLYYMFLFFSSAIAMGAIALAINPPRTGAARGYTSFDLILPLLTMGLYLFVAFGFISRRCERQADVFGSRAGSCARFDCEGHDSTTEYVDGGQSLCKTGIHSFIDALNKVGEINSLRHGMAPTREVSRWRRKVNRVLRAIVEAIDQWLHSTLAKRTNYLKRVIENPDVDRRFQRRFFLMKWAIALVIIGMIIAVGFWRGWDVLWASM